MFKLMETIKILVVKLWIFSYPSVLIGYLFWVVKRTVSFLNTCMYLSKGMWIGNNYNFELHNCLSRQLLIEVNHMN